MGLWRTVVIVWLCLLPCLAPAQVGLNTYGMPGLVEMPQAFALPDADLAATVSYFGKTTRSTLTFQVTPRLTGAFRYAGLEGLGGSLRSTLYDRSFDMQILLAREGKIRPALAFGLRDFIGTGVYSAEYVVASKRFGPWSVTGGVGWGRLGGDGYAARAGPTTSTNQGGQLESTRWLSGDPALFGGATWQIDHRMRFSLEMSSDTYQQETSRGVLNRRTQVNLGLDWRVTDTVRIKAFYLHGAEVGLAVHLRGNPARTRVPSGAHPARTRVDMEGVGAGQTSWQAAVATALGQDGIDLLGLRQSGSTLRVEIRNTRYSASAEAVGRVARTLHDAAPEMVTDFEIVPVESGLRTALIRLARADLARFEFAVDGPEALWQTVRIEEAPRGRGPGAPRAGYPRLAWGLGPYFRGSFFDPDRPLMADIGLRLSGEFAFSPQLVLSGSARKRVAGNFGNTLRASNSVLPKVRSEANRYLSEGDPGLETLTLAYFFRPGPHLYGRLTAGYLEAQYGGLSGELLWKPVDSRLALGAELSYARQRSFNQGFGFRDYAIVTGHLSAYYAMRNGFHAQLDAGRYLAGDWGATVSIDREFRNGWRIGAYATFTDVSFEDFGEGSFDKGLRFTIPLEPFIGKPTRRRFDMVLQPLTRDGGARLHVDGRLYAQVRDFHRQGLQSNWGRVWR